MRKPQRLNPGDKVAIVSLSSGLAGEPFCRHQVDLGVKRLKEFGLEPVFMPNALKGIAWLNAHPEDRAADLKAAFTDETIRGIICVIGGDDTYRLLPYLMEDEGFIKAVRQNPKLFTGFSDTTINHLMFHKLGMVSFYGPNFLSDLAELEDEMLPYTRRAFAEYLNGPQEYRIISSPVWYEERKEFSTEQIGVRRIRHEEQRGFEVLQGNGTFSGRLLGGCLESLYDLLKGGRYPDEPVVCTKYGIFPAKEEWQGKILFIETCEETPDPETLEKELAALKERGVFEAVSGVIIGKPMDERYYEEYKAVFCRVIADPLLPVLYNVNFGHALPRCIIPYGLMAEVDLEAKTITVKESLFT